MFRQAIPFTSFLYGIIQGRYNYKVLKYHGPRVATIFVFLFMIMFKKLKIV